MAFITYPLNNIDYTAEDAELFHCTRTSGIWAEDSFPISVTGADNNVTIGTGIAWINNKEFSGKVAALKSAEVLDLGIADGTYPRIDVIAIQYSANNNATDVVIKKGTPATNPVRPSIVRTGEIYELYLASVYRPAGATAITASNITDLRMDGTVCGLMADSVTKVDMTAIEAQVRNLINNLQNEIDSVRGLVVSKKLLWQNASPKSEFPAQTINLDLSEYDEVEIEIFSSTSTSAVVFQKVTKGKQAVLVSQTYSYRYRMCEATETGIEFNSGGVFGTDWKQLSSGGDLYTIPYKIYGIKGAQ